MKKYRVWASTTTYSFAYVEAETEEEAIDKAGEMDGSDFIETDHNDWDIYSATEVETPRTIREAVGDLITGEKS